MVIILFDIKMLMAPKKVEEGGDSEVPSKSADEEVQDGIEALPSEKVPCISFV